MKPEQAAEKIKTEVKLKLMNQNPLLTIAASCIVLSLCCGTNLSKGHHLTNHITDRYSMSVVLCLWMCEF